MRSGKVNSVNKNKAEEGIRKSGGRGVVSDRLADRGRGRAEAAASNRSVFGDFLTHTY